MHLLTSWKDNQCCLYNLMQKELSPEQLKQRQISQQYLKIQQNTEVLTQIVRYNSRTRKTPIKFNAAIDMRSIIALIVQKSYLLYSCLLRKSSLLLSAQLYARPSRKGEPNAPQQVYCEYLLELELHRYSSEEQQALGRKFRLIDIHRSAHGYGEYLCRFIITIRKKLAQHFERLKANQQGAVIVRQMEGLTALIEGFLMPQVQRLPPKAVIVCLEESEIFREYGMLLKCLNCSLFAAIRFSPKCKEIQQELVELQAGLLAQSKRDQQQNARRIEASIQESVRLLLKYNVVFSQQSLNENSKKQSQQSSKAYVMGDLEGQNDARKYFIKLFVREKPLRKFTPQRLQAILARREGIVAQESGEQSQKERVGRGEYLVQFWSGKSLLCVRYVTQIQLGVENTDILMFHCNYLTYSWSNVALQFVEKTSAKSKRKERYLAFKAISYVHLQQKVVFKILTMLDLLMVYAKIAEPHLRRNIVSVDQYYQKAAELNEHCEHIKRVFIRRIQKNYQALQQKLAKN